MPESPELSQQTSPTSNPQTYAYDCLRAEAVAALAATGLVSASDVALVAPKPNIAADLAFPVFAAAKSAGDGNPAEFAARLASAVTFGDDSLLAKAEALGGFVNLSVHPARWANAVLADVLTRQAEFGRDENVGAGQKTVVEFSSPNIARKMHVGHLRSTVIGNAIRNILVALGYEVIADNHLGDWGTQFGTLLAALDLWGYPEGMKTDPVTTLVEIYAKFNAASEADPVLKDLARAWFKKLEDGDEWARATWKQLIDITLEEFARTYARLGVTFDTTHGESYFEPMLVPIVQEALDKGVAKIEPGGAVSVTFDQSADGGPASSLPSCLLRKTDGGTLYHTRDAATILYRWNEYHPSRNIYVVGQEQKLHFQQVFEIARRMGYGEIADRSIHIAFGPVTDVAGNRFSMRKGTAIFLDEVLDEAVTRARATIAEKIAEGKTELTPGEVDTVSEMIGVAAVVYHDLYQGPERGIRFDWDKMLSFDGNTALYIQYTHARCRSILRKAGEQTGTYDATLLIAPEEQAVLRQLSALPHAVREAGEKFAPALVASWTYDLAREFARFYHAQPVLEAETPDLRAARLALVEAVATGLKNGFALLGIGVPERM